MSDLLSEVDEALFQDRAMEIWRKYGSAIIGAILAVIVLTAAVSGYNSWQDKTSRDQTGKLITLLNAPETNDKALHNFAQSSDGIHASLAYINAAYLRAEKGDGSQAARSLSKASQISSQPTVWREYAYLSEAYFQVNLKELNTSDILTKMTNLSNDPRTIWRYHASLGAAVLEAEENKDYKKALEHLAIVNSASGKVPEHLVETSRKLHHIYTVALNKISAPSSEDPSR